MNCEWQEVPFSEAIDFKEGPGIMARDFHDEGVPLIRVAGLSGAASVLHGCNFLDPEKVKEKWSHFRIRPGDSLLSTSASLGRVAVAGPEAEGAIPYTGIIRMRPKDKKVIASFVPYLLKSPHFQRQVEAMGTGSVLRHFGPSHLRRMTLVLPPVVDQWRIAWFLGSLDAKIDSNRRVAKTLEEIAATLFKARFVDFADHDDLVESEIGLIPKEWKVASLSEITRTLTRGRGPAYVDEGGVQVLNQKCIRDGRVSFEPARRNDEDRRSSTDRRVELGDVLINSTGVGTLGRVAQVRWLPEATTIDSHVTMVRADGTVTEQDYLAMALLMRQGDLERLGHGSTGQTELTRSRLAELSIPIPPMDEQRAFSKSSGPIRSAIAALERESLTLTALRDNLLPRLISGQIRVPAALSA